MCSVNANPQVEKKYSVIYADLPWDDNDWTLEKIRQMPVQTWVGPNALLLLWIPMPLLSSGLFVLNAWGFDYAGMLVWRKLKDDLEDPSLYGEGEFMLVGKIGQVKPSALLRQNLYEAGAGPGKFKPQGFRRVFGHAGFHAFGESATYLDLFGAYWRRKFEEYKQGQWDFLAE